MAESKLKVLAIDDEEESLSLLKLTIEKAFPGAGFFSAPDGAGAVRLALAEDPDVILLDIRLPGTDGFEVCRLLKGNQRLADIPVVFLTALKIKNEVRVKALEAGAESILAKPFKEDDLAPQVRMMAKLKAGNVAQRLQKERLARLLEERTRDLIEEADGHKRTGEALAVVEGRYAQLFNRMTEGFALHEVICDKAGKPVDYRFLDVNPAFERLSGRKRQALLGRTVLELVPGVPKRWIEAFGHVAVTGENLNFEDFTGIFSPEKTYSINVFSPKTGQFAVIYYDVTERKKAEEAGRRKEVMLKGILDNLQDAYVRTDMAGRFVMVSPSTIRMYGYANAAEMIGLSTEALYVSPLERNGVLQALLKTGSVVDQIGQGRRKDGSLFWVSLNAQILRDERGDPAGMEGFVRDITERRVAEEALAAERRQMDAIIESSPVGLLILDEKLSIVRANSAVAAIAGADLEDIGRHRPGEALGCANARADARGCGHAPGCSLCPLRKSLEALLASGEPLCGVEARMELERDGERRQVWLLVGAERITLDGRPHAVVSIDDITEKKAAEASEERSRAKYAAIFGQSPIAIEYYDADGALMGANEACIEMFGVVDISEIAGSKLFDDPNISDDVKARLRRGETVHVEAPFDFEKVKEKQLYRTTRSGVAVLDYQIAPMVENKKNAGYVVQVLDVTERREAEEALKESERRFSDAFEHTTLGMALVSTEGRWLKVNEAICDILGYSGEELLTKTFKDITHPDDLPANLDMQHGLLSGRISSFKAEKRYFQKSGRLVWAMISVAIVRDNGGKPLYFVTQLNDITSQKAAETATQRRGELLSAINSSGELSALLQKVTGLLRGWSGCEAVGVRLKEAQDFPYFETQGFPPEFVQAENSLCARDQAGELCRDSAGNPVIECMCGNVLCGRFDPAKPFFTAKGSFWSNCTTDLLASTTDKDRQTRTRNRCNGEGYESVALIPLRAGMELLGLLQLNSRQKNRFDLEFISFIEYAADQLAIAISHLQAQAALRESEDRLKKAQTAARVGNWEVNLKTSELWASEEARLIYGFALTEKLTLDQVQKAPLEKFRPALNQALSRLLDAGEGYDLEFEISRQNSDEVLWVHSKAELSIDRSGVSKVTGVIQDITGRKQAEKVLQDLIEKNPMSIQIVDSGGFTLKANPSFMRLFNSVPPPGFSIFEDISRRSPELYALILRAKAGEVVHLPDTYYDPHDALPAMLSRPVWLHAVIFPLKDSSGKVERLVLMHEDVTARKLADDKIKASLAEKEVLLKEVHHRVKNNLQVVSSLLNLQSKTLKDETARTLFQESRARVRAMALVHEILYRTQDFAKLNMREYAGKLIDGLMASYKAGAEVRFESDICDCPLSVDTAVSLGLILNELVSNSFKYAFHGARAGRLKVSLSREAGGYCLAVEDDGPGLPPDYDLRKAKSLGMQLVASLAGQISGTVGPEPSQGARILVRFPG